MNTRSTAIGAALGAAAFSLFALAACLAPSPSASSNAASAETAPAKGSARVVLAGGCFWGMEAVFDSLKGVTKVTSGYSGGEASTAHYDDVSSGTTGHAESVEITYDPKRITFNQILDVYFRVAHDPTELNQQGPDEGSQYRSEIYYTTAAQKKTAEDAIHTLTVAKVYPGKIVTLVAPLKAFYPAEAYHQHFIANHPDYPYVVINDLPKLEHLKHDYPNLLKKGA